MGRFTLSKSSLKELQGVNADLIALVRRAIELSPQDFAVHDGTRTLAEQQRLVASGASQTLHSRHITGDAVDLVPLINGKLRWEWPPIYAIADAVRVAANELGTPLRWGGAWDVAFTPSTESPEDLVSGYISRRRSLGLRAFIDGPHYELLR